MKKFMILAALGLFTFGYSASAQTSPEKGGTVVTSTSTGVEKIPVKPEDLPAPVKKVLASDAYKGWTPSEAFLVKDKTEYYEIIAKKEAETKILKLDKEGVVVE